MQGWPTKADAAKALGVSTQTIRRMQQRGDLNPKLILGVWRYDPAELAQVSPSLDEMNPAAIIEAASSLTEQAHDHVEELIEKNLKMNEREHATHELLATENERLRNRITRLEDRQIEMFEVYADMIQQTHDREMERVRVEAKEKRTDQAVGLFMKLAPEALSQYMTSRVGNELADVVLGIPDDEFEAICQSGVLPQDKVNTLRKVRQQLKETADAHHQTRRPDVPPVSPEQGGVPEAR